MREAEIQSLIEQALAGRELAYAPYSRYRVGAALLGQSGRVYAGCNVENASYPVCNCAERTALFKAVSEGEQRFSAIAVVGGREEERPPLRDYAYPCGVCRQALEEFRLPTVIVARSKDDYKVYDFAQLLPFGFNAEQL